MAITLPYRAIDQAHWVIWAELTRVGRAADESGGGSYLDRLIERGVKLCGYLDRYPDLSDIADDVSHPHEMVSWVTYRGTYFE